MTREDVIRELDAQEMGDDQEAAHTLAEDALLAFLRDEGYGDVADAFTGARERVGYWYA